MTEATNIFRSTIKIFGERDPSIRLAAIRELYAEDVVFTDPEGSVVGHAAIDEKVAQLLQNSPAGFVFVEDGPLYLSGDGGALAWAFGPPGAPVVRGLDVMTVRDGRIASLVTLIAG